MVLADPVTTDPAPPEAPPPEPVALKARLEAVKAKAEASAVGDPAPAVEPEKPAEPAPVAPVEKTGAALAKLAKEQKAAREAREALKAEKAALDKEIAAKRQELEKELSELKAFQEAKANAKRFPLKAIEPLGLTAEMVNEALLNGGDPTANLEVQAVKDEIAKLRTEAEQEKQRLAEERKREVEEQRKYAEQQQAEAIKAFHAECVAFVDQHADKYELTAALEQQHLVFQTIAEFHRQTEAQGKPRLLSIEEAAAEVEKTLEAQVEKATKTKKYTAKVAVKPPQPKAALVKPTEQATKTLSNTASAPSAGNPARPESLAERRARVLAKLV